VDVAYAWDTGLMRKLNEDTVLYSLFDLRSHLGEVRAGLFTVADGMGGHNAGEIASDLAVRTFHIACTGGLLAPSPTSPLSIMAEAFNRANSAVLEAAQDSSMEGMGTTLTSALIISQDMYITHIGDSRCYIISEHETLQVTTDHSVVQQMIDAGLITPEQARTHPRRNEITRSLGYSRSYTPDLRHVKLYAGDNVLLCSDGLCGVLPNDRIAATVREAPSLKQAADDLASLANLAGGPDNISVILVKPSGLPSWQTITSAQTGIRIK
jgi:serine/threonine protein phosphatase PrpC